MSAGSSIQWTEQTWNPIAGCTPVSPGCLHCYAATMSHRLHAMGQAQYRGLTVLHNGVRTFNGKITLDEDALAIPLKWKKPKLVFVNSMSDLFHEKVPFEFIDKVFAVMAICRPHTFQILTKRPEQMAEYLAGLTVGDGPDPDRWDAARRPLWLAAKRAGKDGLAEYIGVMGAYPRWPLPNVWLGTSVEDQQRADERIPHLLRCQAAVRFLSVEPLLGEIDLRNVSLGLGESIDDVDGPPQEFTFDALNGTVTEDRKIDWVIVGGESGAGARTCDVEAVRNIVEQCAAAEVPCFVKQLGSEPYFTRANEKHFYKQIHDSKGGDPSEWPEDLRVRQMPEATVPA